MQKAADRLLVLPQARQALAATLRRGYDLRIQKPSGRCPECGRIVPDTT